MSDNGRFTKDKDEGLDYTINWSNWLTTADAITASTWTGVGGIPTASPTATTSLTTIWAYSGSAGFNYKLTNTIVTVSGRTGQRSIFIAVEDL